MEDQQLPTFGTKDAPGNKHQVSPEKVESPEFQKQFEKLYKQHLAIFSSLPIGVGVYSPDGSLLYFNEAICRIFGVNAKDSDREMPNVNNNPLVPIELKNAIRDGKPMHIRFAYDFAKINEAGYFNSVHNDTHYMECNGRPIINDDGRTDNYILMISDVTEQVNAEEKLRNSRKKIDLAMQAADIIFWEFDLKTNCFTSDTASGGKYDISISIPYEEFMDAIHPDDREKINGIAQRMHNGEDFSFNFEDRILFPGNSEWQYCAVSGSPFERDANGKVVKYVGTRKNNTEQHRKKVFLEKILNDIPLSIHIKDVENNFRYVFCNKESKQLFGTSEDKTTHDVLDEDEVSRIQKTDLEVFNTGKPYFGLEHIVLKDGRCYDTIVRKSIINDGDKRLLLNTRWEQGLQNEEKRRSQILSLTLESMNAYTWFYEPGKMRVSFGDGFAKFGRRATEVNTLDKFLACIHPDDRSYFSGSLEKLTAQDSGMWYIEYRIDLNGEGIYKWCETHGILETQMLNDAPYKYVFGMTIDIHTHKQAMAELEHAKKIAEQSDKLKSAFLANMSHEIRTPLNAIVGFSELLANVSDQEEKDEYLQIINNNNELLLKLINDILDLSKLESGNVELKYEKFDLSEYFDNMASSMKQRVTNPNIRLLAVNPYHECTVNLDRNRIAQILTNYVTNSIKYTPKGFIEMGYNCTPAGIYFYVKDSGIGIPDDKKAKVFHRFEKLDEFAQGTGLGLSICKAIAESMGGSVGFQSDYGEGSLFWAELPCSPLISTEEPAAKHTEEEYNRDSINRTSLHIDSAQHSEGNTILIAEDMPGNYRLLSAILKKHFNLLHARDGQEAVDMVRNNPVDIILMDIKMPVMDGLGATREIRRFNKKLPVIALSAYAFETDRVAALEAGCNEYLVKPVNKSQLMSVLKKYNIA